MPAIRKEELDKRDQEIQRLRARIDELELGCGPAPEPKTSDHEQEIERLQKELAATKAELKQIEDCSPQRISDRYPLVDKDDWFEVDVFEYIIDQLKNLVHANGRLYELKQEYQYDIDELRTENAAKDRRIAKLKQQLQQVQTTHETVVKNLQMRTVELEAEVVHLKSQQLTTTITPEGEEIAQQPVATRAAATDILASVCGELGLPTPPPMQPVPPTNGSTRHTGVKDWVKAPAPVYGGSDPDPKDQRIAELEAKVAEQDKLIFRLRGNASAHIRHENEQLRSKVTELEQQAAEIRQQWSARGVTESAESIEPDQDHLQDEHPECPDPAPVSGGSDPPLPEPATNEPDYKALYEDMKIQCEQSEFLRNALSKAKDDLIQKNRELVQENTDLKRQIEELNAKLAQYEGMATV